MPATLSTRFQQLDNAEKLPQSQSASLQSNDAPVSIEPTVVAYKNYKDPLIGLNRAGFVFNDLTYLLTPTEN